MMQAAGDSGCLRLIYAGSEMATGWLTTNELPPRFPFNEEDRVESPNAYALSKYLGEVIADSMVVALEGESTGHEVYLIAAADTCIDVPLREAVKQLYGKEGNFAPSHGNFDSAFDCGKIKRDFGWQARYSWRDRS